MLKKFQTIKNPPRPEDFDTLYYNYYIKLLFRSKYTCINVERTFTILGYDFIKK
jgi:hypothetical protein